MRSGQKAKQYAANPRSQQSQRSQRSRDGLAHAQIAHQQGQHQRVKHRIEGVQRPSHGRRQQRAPLPGRRLPDQLYGTDDHE